MQEQQQLEAHVMPLATVRLETTVAGVVYVLENTLT